MRYQSATLIWLFLFLTLLFGCKPDQDSESTTPLSQSNDYITAEEYVVFHPEEMKKREAFNTLVQNSAKKIKPGQQKHTINIAIVYPGEQASDYWRRSLKSFIARLDEIGIQYDIHEFFSKGGGVETRKQEEQLKKALDLDPDYLVFTLDVRQHIRVIERILSNKRPFLILQNITTPLSRWENNQPFYVGFDHATGSRLLADYFLENTSPDGSYGLLYYSKGYVSTMRGDTFLEYMRKANGPILADSYYTAGKREFARINALNLLQHEDLKFIYNCATDVALGAMDALKENGKIGTILINGWGGGSAEIDALLAGDLDVTVMRMNDDNGVAMAEAIRLQLLGRENELPTVFSGEFTVITRHTSKEQIQALQKRAFRYSGIEPGM